MKIKLDLSDESNMSKNNDEKNLITLCNSCHAKTNFNRENWIEFFKVYHE